MSDPTRMIDEVGDGVTELERALLRAGRQQRLSTRDRQEAWTGLGAAIAALPVAPPAPPGVGGGASGAGVAGATKAVGATAILKGTVLAVVASVGAWGAFGSRAGNHAIGSQASEVASPAPQVRAPAPAAQPVVEPFEPLPVPERGEAPPPRVPARAAHDDTHRPPSSRLAAEGRVVLEARRELREGDAAAALRRLEEARVTFADGALIQEREALTIEALHRAGQRDLAATRARAFLRAYPGSPHAARVHAFATP